MFLPPFRTSARETSPPSLQATASTAQQALDTSSTSQVTDIDMTNLFDLASQDAAHYPALRPTAASSSVPSAPDLSTATSSASGMNQPAHSPPLRPSDMLQLPAFSASTQEILRRINATQKVSTSSLEWEAARQQVLKNMAAAPAEASTQTTTNLIAPTRRGRGRGRPPNSLRLGVGGGTRREGGVELISLTEDLSPWREGSERSRARGGRPRGSGRGGATRGRRKKRKRGNSDEEDDDDNPGSSDASHPSTPKAPTVTKSGRSITKPLTFTPIVDKPPSQQFSPHTPSSISARGGSSRRRGGRRATRPSDLVLCAKCSRGHSPESNVIVFCDGCNTPWHQWCHDPHISREVVEVAEKEWFCGLCMHKQEEGRAPIDERVSGASWSPEEKASYFDTLGRDTLRLLLDRALNINPDLPVFPPHPLRHDTTTETPLTPSDAAAPILTKPKYPDIAVAAATNDPPSTYPRPGNGPVRPKPITGPEDVQWLLDDGNGFSVFSHFYDEPNGDRETNGEMPEKQSASNGVAIDTLVHVVGAGEQGVKGSWIQKQDA